MLTVKAHLNLRHKNWGNKENEILYKPSNSIHDAKSLLTKSFLSKKIPIVKISLPIDTHYLQNDILRQNKNFNNRKDNNLTFRDGKREQKQLSIFQNYKACLLRNKKMSTSSDFKSRNCNMTSSITININNSLRSNIVSTLEATKLELSKSIASSLSRKNSNFDFNVHNPFLNNLKSRKECTSFNIYEIENKFDESPKRHKYNLLMKSFIKELLPEENEINLIKKSGKKNLMFNQLRKRI